MEKDKRPDKSLQLTYSIVAVILAVAAIAMVAFALTHPGYQFPWQTWSIYGIAILSIIYAVLFFITSRLEGADICTLIIVLFTYVALVFFLLSIAMMQESGKTSWYLAAGLILSMLANFGNIFFRKPKKEAKNKKENN